MAYHLKKLVFLFMRRLVAAAYAFCFRRVIIKGYEEIKNKKPALFVANHQGTFMDGILMDITARNAMPYILVRADVFESDMAAKALDSIRLLPIYRKRDGYDSAAKNERVFEKCCQLLEKKEIVALFPEGNHAIERRLRPLQKGAARIAFRAEEMNDFQLGVSVIPVGIHYENHAERWHNVQIHYGKPIDIAPYRAIFEENEQKAYRDLTDKMRVGLEKNIIDIKGKEEYTFFEQLRQILKPYSYQLVPDASSRLQAENILLEKIRMQLKDEAEKLNQLKERVSQYFKKAKDIGLSTNFIVQEPDIFKFFLHSLKLFVGLPFWAVAKVVNALPEYIINEKVVRKTKDRAWHLSLRVGISTFLYPIYYGLLWLVFSLIWDWVIGGLIVFSLPICSVIHYELEYLFEKYKNYYLLLKNQEFLREEKNLLDEIKDLLK